MKDNTYCVIMAGGVGSRFWPLSKSSTPKQFLDILGTGKSLLRQTFDRFMPLCPKENFLIVTSAWIRTRNKNANIVVTPADHLIINESVFIQSIEDGLGFVQDNNALLTLGIKPHRPETGYGYIQIGNKATDKYPGFNKVKTFTEKPNAELAKVFYESGEFFWNSGIFIWTLGAIDKAFQSNLPEVQNLFLKLDNEIGTANETEALNNIYIDCKNISIDYGVMEKANNVFVQTVNFGWSDLGTWTSLYEYSAQDKNKNAIINGKIVLYDTEQSIINIPGEKVAVIQGLKDYIVVDSGDALLICPKANEQQIRQFTTDIKTEFGDEVL
jgi:mannose-1-phosphate guanylyltransferase